MTITARDLIVNERKRILNKAARYIQAAPRTVTADRCERSGGGAHDYFSEGSYWWPNPEEPEGPYVRRDGETNYKTFRAHRESVVRLSEIVGTLTSAWLITNEEEYAERAVAHLAAWYVDEDTRMNPSLQYAQAIKGHCSGRGIGIIDTLHFVEVALGAVKLSGSRAFAEGTQKAVKTWFSTYLNWLNTHPYGLAEKEHPNNHGVCWSLQASAFASLVGDQDTLDWVRHEFKTNYLGVMMDEAGGFPEELGRTKPYCYSLFVIDAMAGIAQLASNHNENLWTHRLEDGRCMARGLEFIMPYIRDKDSWPYRQDVMYWDEWPVRHPCLLLGGTHFGNSEYLSLWRSFDPDPTTFEVLRNLPLRHPLLWMDASEGLPR